MKKLILSLTLILAVTFTAIAQPGRTVRKKVVRKYYSSTPAPRPRPWHKGNTYDYRGLGELRLHLAGELGFTDIAGIFYHVYPNHFSAGGMMEVQTGRWLSLGLGAEYYATRSDSYNSLYQNDLSYFRSVPIYANIRLSSPGPGAKCFVEARAGYAIPLNVVGVGSPADYYVTQGFFTGGGIGISCYGNNISVGMNTIDIRNYNGIALLENNNGHGTPNIITDFYIRYSYAIPLNY